METINVEQIIRDVQLEIEKAGYSESDLNWDNIAIDNSSCIDDATYNEAVLLEQANYLANHHRIHWDRPLRSGVKGLTQKAVRKLIKFMIVPSNEEQCAYNLAVERCIEQLVAAELKRKEDFNNLYREVDLLTEQVERLISQIEGSKR